MKLSKILVFVLFATTASLFSMEREPIVFLQPDQVVAFLAANGCDLQKMWDDARDTLTNEQYAAFPKKLPPQDSPFGLAVGNIIKNIDDIFDKLAQRTSNATVHEVLHAIGLNENQSQAGQCLQTDVHKLKETTDRRFRKNQIFRQIVSINHLVQAIKEAIISYFYWHYLDIRMVQNKDKFYFELPPIVVKITTNYDNTISDNTIMVTSFPGVPSQRMFPPQDQPTVQQQPEPSSWLKKAWALFFTAISLGAEVVRVEALTHEPPLRSNQPNWHLATDAYDVCLPTDNEDIQVCCDGYENVGLQCCVIYKDPRDVGDDSKGWFKCEAINRFDDRCYDVHTNSATGEPVLVKCSCALQSSGCDINATDVEPVIGRSLGWRNTPTVISLDELQTQKGETLLKQWGTMLKINKVPTIIITENDKGSPAAAIIDTFKLMFNKNSSALQVNIGSIFGHEMVHLTQARISHSSPLTPLVFLACAYLGIIPGLDFTTPICLALAAITNLSLTSDKIPKHQLYENPEFHADIIGALVSGDTYLIESFGKLLTTNNLFDKKTLAESTKSKLWLLHHPEGVILNIDRHPHCFTRMQYLYKLSKEFPAMYQRLLDAARRHQNGKRLSHPEPMDENDNHAGPAAINGEQKDRGGEETC